ASTGEPFGTYTYARSLGPLVLGVPALVPLAWLMMGYPSFVLAEQLVANYIVLQSVSRRSLPWLTTGTLAGAAMAAWDVFLDPQMVTAGHWRWADPTPGLPGVSDVPLTNLAGWLV